MPFPPERGVVIVGQRQRPMKHEGVEVVRRGAASVGEVSFALVFDLLGRPCGARCNVPRCGWEQRIPSPELARWLLLAVEEHAHSIHQ